MCKIGNFLHKKPALGMKPGKEKHYLNHYSYYPSATQLVKGFNEQGLKKKQCSDSGP